MGNSLFKALPDVVRQIATAKSLAIFLDYDGALTPFVNAPETANLSSGMRQILEGLAEDENVLLAVVSGRSLIDLENRISIPGVAYAGNQGLEIRGRGCAFTEPTAVERSRALQELAEELTRRLQPVAGAFVENKCLTASVHYRGVASTEHEHVQQIVRQALSLKENDFLMASGNMVHEIRPNVPWDKGTGIRWIREQMNLGDALNFYIGADLADEDTLAAITDGIPVHVGSSEGASARFQLDNPAHLQRFLAWLLNRVAERFIPLAHQIEPLSVVPAV